MVGESVDRFPIPSVAVRRALNPIRDSAREVVHEIVGCRQRVVSNEYRVDALMATQSGSILLGAVDRMVYSPVNYWVVMLSDLAAALAFLALGLHRFSGPWVMAGGVVLAGFLSCGLLEYVVHRWVLHGPPSLARRGHAQHHAEPRALISTPLFVIMTGALALWGLLGLVLPAGLAALLVFGLYAGYNYFALVHHQQHHRGKDVACVAYWRRLEQLHHLHHHRPAVNFGISTTIWDRLFGTFKPTHAPATDYVFWSTIRSYWMKLTCKPSATS
jgi:sterol desaturase/sphingolipid hydroxylase (fatty acid hydroxylase superfamily)